jgi:hypothetical protein
MGDGCIFAVFMVFSSTPRGSSLNNTQPILLNQLSDWQAIRLPAWNLSPVDFIVAFFYFFMLEIKDTPRVVILAACLFLFIKMLRWP